MSLRTWRIIPVLLLTSCIFSRPAQLGLFSDLCTWSPDVAPECCLKHDGSFAGGEPREFMIANHEFALCLYSHEVNPGYVEAAFDVVSSKQGWKHFNVTEFPQRRIPLNYPHSCEEWQW